MNIFTDFINNDLLKSLSWTLIHLIWQSSLIAAILFFWLKIFSTKSSVFKYNSAYFCLILILVIGLFTFFSKSESAKFNVKASQSYSTTDDNSIELKALKDDDKASLSNYSAKNFSWFHFVGIAWLIGITILSLRLLGGFLILKKAQRTSHSIDINWAILLDKLKVNLQISKAIKLVGSTSVSTPIMIGLLKPVIILPTGLLSGLSTEEIENILIHELAHIKRNDYLMNIIQSIIEVLFFYIPPVWWISQVIRSERENCCDDFCINYSGSKIFYAKTLITIADFSTTQNKYAMSINNNKSVLFNRIKRLINPEQGPSSTGRWIAGMTLASLVMILIFSSFISKAAMGFFQDKPEKIPPAVIAPSMEEEPIESVEPLEAVKAEEDVQAEIHEEEEDPNSRRLNFEFVDKEGNQQEVSFVFSPDGKEIQSISVNEQVIPKEKFISNKKIMDFVKGCQLIDEKRRTVDMASEKDDIAWEKEELKFHEEEMKQAFVELENEKEELKWRQSELARREKELARRTEDMEFRKNGKPIPPEVLKKREQEEAQWKAEEKKRDLYHREREAKESARHAEHLERQKQELKHREMEIAREKKQIEFQEEEMKYNKEFEKLFDEEIKNLK